MGHLRLFRFGAAAALAAVMSAAAPAAAQTVPKDVLSLVVNGEDPAHLTAALEHLVWLKKNRFVRVGNVFIVDFASAGQPAPVGSQPSAEVEAAIESLDPATREQIVRLREATENRIRNRAAPGRNQRGADVSEAVLEDYAKQAGVPEQGVLQSRAVFSRLDAQYSPTWVIRHRGADYVLEGFTDLSQIFNQKGDFIRDSR